ncbi:hypothetical protein TRVA0_044S01398 [Trichomonascus vanleenenianus]|uniref:uncharacterized protein n=1 Tax=Trichomonascus vanleenenianus TaxID=2268995 RepID=UPI003EC982E6
MVTVVPPIKSLAGADYVDAQTQTEANPSSSDAPEKDFTEKSMGKELQKLSEKAELSEVDSVKHTLEELSSIVTSLSFSGFGGRAITLDSLMKNKSKKTTEEKNQIDEFKKEIRSIKGSLLSTRNFPR